MAAGWRLSGEEGFESRALRPYKRFLLAGFRVNWRWETIEGSHRFLVCGRR